MFDNMTERLPGAVYTKDHGARLYVPPGAPATLLQTLARTTPSLTVVQDRFGKTAYLFVSHPVEAIAAVALLKSFYPTAVIEDYEPPIDIAQARRPFLDRMAEAVRAERPSDTPPRTDWAELSAKFTKEREERARKEAEDQAAARRKRAEERAAEDKKARDEYWARRRANGGAPPPPHGEWDRNINPAPKPPSPFAVLFLLDTAPEWAVKAVYKAAMKEHHPDRPGTTDKTGGMATRINAAFAAIKKVKGWT